MKILLPHKLNKYDNRKCHVRSGWRALFISLALVVLVSIFITTALVLVNEFSYFFVGFSIPLSIRVSEHLHWAYYAIQGRGVRL